MATYDQVAAQIRFALDQLRLRNGHHEFEHLCRYYSRQRICSNLLPATGPVGAGGDQGRDFESFSTFGSVTDWVGTWLPIDLDHHRLAFACTLTSADDKIEGKIKDDVTKICSGHPQVQAVHYFCSISIQVSLRHRLQEWARDYHSIHLEIHDGMAIAEGLAQPDTFWIATRFLEIPSEIFPRTDTGGADWYEELRSRLKVGELRRLGYVEFESIRRATRRATFTKTLKLDLQFWIEQLSRFQDNDVPRSLNRRAFYEIAVARLRGLGDLLGCEDTFDDYFLEIPNLVRLDDIQDAVLLASYCTSATGLGHAHFELGRLEAWHLSTITLLDRLLAEQTCTSSRRAHLLQLRSHTAMRCFKDGEITPTPTGPLQWWLKIIDLVPEAPLFPLDTFADCMTAVCPNLGDNSEFASLTARIDELLAKRVGGFIAAEKCRDRAVAHYAAGQILDAIREVHKAKINWFAEETLGGSLLAMLLLSHWYRELGLAMASKYYGLVIADIAIGSQDAETRALAWRGLAEAATSDYYLGAWCGFIDLSKFAITCHDMLAANPGNIDQHPDFGHLLFHLGMMNVLVLRLAPKLSRFVADRTESLGVQNLLVDLIVHGKKRFKNMRSKKLWAEVDEQFQGFPISDVGASRTTQWGALGIRWTVQWSNDYESNRHAEQFIACLQIVQSELARLDMCVLNVDVSLDFQLADVAELAIEPRLEMKCLSWKVKWPSRVETSDARSMYASIVTAAISVIQRVSLLANAPFDTNVECIFNEGLAGKAIFGDSYVNLYSRTVPLDEFNEGRRVFSSASDGQRIKTVKIHPMLAAHSGPGPGYSKEESTKQIENRYSRARSLLGKRAQNLFRTKGGAATIRKLREKGWKDWHILGSMLTVVVNARARQHNPNPTPDDFKVVFESVRNDPLDVEQWQVPLSEFTLEKMEFARRGNLGAILISWGLEINHPAIQPAAIEKLLDERFGYWSDDAPHDPIFV